MEDIRVSCLMVTADRPVLARRAILSFARQTHRHRELVVLDNGTEPMQHLLTDLPESQVRYAHVRREPGEFIGALRNKALAMATGDAVIPQWDDDDWSHPERIATQVAALRNGVDACTLPAYLVHFDDPAFFEHPFVGRIREGTCLLHRRDDAITYPNLQRTSDTVYIQEWLRRTHVKLPSEAARLYVRTFHGSNLWDERHILRRLRSTPRDLAAYGWHRFVRRNLLRHPRFRLDAAARDAFAQYLIDSAACGIFPPSPRDGGNQG